MSPSEPVPAVTAPTVGLSPTDVVLAQLEGFHREPYAGAGAGPGIRAAWSFASPGNREATGPLEVFAEMVRGPVYGGLLGHRAAQVGPPVERGNEATLEVLVHTAGDETIGFTWVLGRQLDPPYAGCWMTDGVLRHPDRAGR